jgi:hypothetical protein
MSVSCAFESLPGDRRRTPERATSGALRRVEILDQDHDRHLQVASGLAGENRARWAAASVRRGMSPSFTPARVDRTDPQ